MSVDALLQPIRDHLELLGFELVDLRRTGTMQRPILQVRVDRPDSRPGQGVTADDCAGISRSLERFLESRALVGPRYVLEVSSPGVERPLVRRRDFERFAGQEVAIKTKEPVGEHGKRLEGVLRGVRDADGREIVELDVGGDRIEIERDDIARAHLVFRWDEK